jgi:hypothetical protein
VAASKGHLNVVQWLVRDGGGADVNQADQRSDPTVYGRTRRAP